MKNYVERVIRYVKERYEIEVDRHSIRFFKADGSGVVLAEMVWGLVATLWELLWWDGKVEILERDEKSRRVIAVIKYRNPIGEFRTLLVIEEYEPVGCYYVLTASI